MEEMRLSPGRMVSRDVTDVRKEEACTVCRCRTDEQRRA